MAKVDGSIRSLIQGVSQQPPKTRLPGQCTEQINCSSNPVDGLTRRPPLEYVATLMELAPEDSAQFYYNKLGADKEFLTIALNGDLKVFDLEGDEQVVNIEEDSLDYLDGSPLCFGTLEDKTFIANKRVTVSMDEDDENFTEFVSVGTLMYVLGGQYSRTYTATTTWESGGVEVSTTVTHTTPNGSNVSHGAQVAPSFIANALKTLMEADTTNSFNSLFTVNIKGDVLYIHWTDPTETAPFSIAVTDDEGGTHLKAINGRTTNAANLPRYAPHGYHVAITGDGAASQDDWFLQFRVNSPIVGSEPTVGSGFGSDGVWVETHEKGIPTELVLSTMPHVLEYDHDLDEFEFYTGEWLGRQVGNEDSNANPSFVGRTIEDISYFQGRLVFLSGPAVIMSRTNKPFDFWIESATANTDSDSIDIESTAQGVSRMMAAVPHNRDLVVFSDGGQFIVFGRNAITASNSSLVLTTAFESNLDARPVPAGRNIFFAINYGNYGGIREFFVEGSQDINDSRPITQHVLKYIQGSVKAMSASSNFDTLLVQADAPDKLYVYEYIWLDSTKVQSSWGTWVLPNPVRHVFFVESVIYVVSQVGNKLVLEKMDLDISDDEGLTYPVYLDRKVVYEEVNDAIEILPGIDPNDMIFIQGKGAPQPGLRVLVQSYDSNTRTVTLNKDMEGGNVIAGQRYRSSYIPTLPVIRDQGGSAIGTGKLIITKFFLNIRRTGSTEATIRSKYGEDRTIRFTGRHVGNPDSLIGEPAIVDAPLTIPFREAPDNAELEIFTDSHLPLTVIDIEWVGQYTKRGRRVTGGDN